MHAEDKVVLKLLGWGVVVAILCGMLEYALANSGLCVASGRVASDRNYFGDAIEAVIKSPGDMVIEAFPGKTVAKQVHVIPYQSVDEFLKENPDCCKFGETAMHDGNPSFTLWDQIFGMRVVEVDYAKKYLDEAGVIKSVPVHGRVAVTPCGSGW